MSFAVLINTDCSLTGSQELAFGLRSLQRFCESSTGYSGWQTFNARDGLDAVRTLLRAQGTGNVLVILNPALVTTGEFAETLARVLVQHPQQVVVAADPRSARGEWQIDYASRSGLERYVARRAALPESARAEEHAPWAFMASTKTLERLLNESRAGTWLEVGQKVAADAIVAQHAFVHSFADYQSSDRQDILDMVPAHVMRLMDVGGGEGWFLSRFMAERPAKGVLVEPAGASVAIARSRGLDAIEARFDVVSVQSCGLFDCISFLDVMEHLEDPLGALQHAATLLQPEGTVLLSVPNVGHWSVVEDLLEGRFDYLPLGILCNTHLRFYTEASLRELLSDAGYQVVAWRNQPSPMPERLRSGLQAGIAAGLALSWNSLETDSFHVLARKA